MRVYEINTKPTESLESLAMRASMHEVRKLEVNGNAKGVSWLRVAGTGFGLTVAGTVTQALALLAGSLS